MTAWSIGGGVESQTIIGVAWHEYRRVRRLQTNTHVCVIAEKAIPLYSVKPLRAFRMLQIGASVEGFMNRKCIRYQSRALMASKHSTTKEALMTCFHKVNHKNQHGSYSEYGFINEHQCPMRFCINNAFCYSIRFRGHWPLNWRSNTPCIKLNRLNS